MIDNKWHSGKPPSCGWWIASTSKDTGILRWWDGNRWSIGVTRREGSRMAGKCAAMLTEFNVSKIQWKHRPDSWPARSRT